jgi:hypothetical protein
MEEVVRLCLAGLGYRQALHCPTMRIRIYVQSVNFASSVMFVVMLTLQCYILPLKVVVLTRDPPT